MAFEPSFLLGLDFDGVVCDSVMECFVSSWLALHPDYRKEGITDIPLELKNLFFKLRPFIRSGEDYVLIQELIDRGRCPSDQESFDREISRVGPDKMKENRDLFYRGRAALLQSDRELWVNLNRLYPHMEKPLRRLYHRQNIQIISTKRSEFIQEILVSRDIRFPIERIHYVDRTNKLALVENLLETGPCKKALFIDDQIDHLTGSSSEDIEVGLASWGYVKNSWLDNTTGIPVIHPSDMEGIFRKAESSG